MVCGVCEVFIYTLVYFWEFYCLVGGGASAGVRVGFVKFMVCGISILSEG